MIPRSRTRDWIARSIQLNLTLLSKRITNSLTIEQGTFSSLCCSGLSFLPYYSPSPSSRLCAFHPRPLLAGFSVLLPYPVFGLPLASLCQAQLTYKATRAPAHPAPSRRTKGLPTVANKLRAFGGPTSVCEYLLACLSHSNALEDRLPRSANVMSAAQ